MLLPKIYVFRYINLIHIFFIFKIKRNNVKKYLIFSHKFKLIHINNCIQFFKLLIFNTDKFLGIL